MTEVGPIRVSSTVGEPWRQFSLAQSVAHGVRGLTAHAREHMGVGVEGDRDAGVPHELLDELRVYVLLEEERRAGVAQACKVIGLLPRPARFSSGAKDLLRRFRGLMKLQPSPAETSP